MIALLILALCGRTAIPSQAVSGYWLRRSNTRSWRLMTNEDDIKGPSQKQSKGGTSRRGRERELEPGKQANKQARAWLFNMEPGRFTQEKKELDR